MHYFNIIGTEYFEDNNSPEQLSISDDSDFSFYRSENSESNESTRRVGFVKTDTLHAKISQSPKRSLEEVNSSTNNHKMILVNRKTDMMPFTDLDPMMFF